MRLYCFGKLSLEHNGQTHNSPYIALLALSYLAIEGEIERAELANMLQADDADKKVINFREGRNTDKESKALRNFRRNLKDLEDKVGVTLISKNESGNDVIGCSELSCDVQEFFTIEDNIDSENIDKALELSKRGTFLGDFEAIYNRGKLKRHFEKATDLNNWIEQKRNKILNLVTEARNSKDGEEVTFEMLQQLLPNFLGLDINEINAEVIAEFEHRIFSRKDEQKCKAYVQDYVENHLQRISEEGIQQDNIYRVLQGLELVSKDNVHVVQKALSLSDTDFQKILEDLEVDAWIQLQVEQDWINENSHISVIHGGKLLRGRLARNYNEYLELVIKLVNSSTPLVQYELLKDFFLVHPIVELDDAEDKVVPVICNLIRSLIYEQEVNEATDIAESVIYSLRKIKDNYRHELGFWYAYALERGRNYKKSSVFLKDLRKEVDEEDQEDLYDRVSALSASVLSRISKSKRDTKRAKEMAEEVLESDSNWAIAEAENVLGRISFAQDEDLFRTKKHFNRAALLWESLGEPVRQLGAMSNFAAILDRNGKIKEAEAQYEKVFLEGLKQEVNSDFWIGILQNRAMFYQDCIFEGIAPNTELYSVKAAEGIKELKRAIEFEDISPYVEALAYQNIATYHVDLNETEEAQNNYQKMLEIARTANLPDKEGLAMIGLAKCEYDSKNIQTEVFDKFELGISFLEKGGFSEDATISKKDYTELLISVLEDKILSDELRSEIMTRLNSN